MIDYCNEWQLEGEQRESFLFVVSALDSWYLDFSAKRNKSTASKGGKRGTTGKKTK